MIIWAYLEPCDIKRYPEITRFQAMTLGELEPMAKMSQWQWKQAMLRGCDMIDGFLKDLERPPISRADATKKGTKYTVVAMTTEKPLTRQTYLSLPDFRTGAPDFTLVRR
jgi:hypothetical protein